jgi:hypothetical protein
MISAFIFAVGGFYDRDASRGQVIAYLIILLFVCGVAFLAIKNKRK